MKKVDLTNITKTKYGNTYRYKWGKSIGAEVSFIYNDISGTFKILDYYKENGNFYVSVDYNGKIKNINPRYLYEKELNLEELFRDDNGQIWKYKIGDHLKDNKRNITIINRKYNTIEFKTGNITKIKQYQYKCNICGFDSSSIDLWVNESHMNTGGCACCNHGRTVTGINDIGTTSPDILDYFVDKNFAYTHSKYSTQKTEIKCPNCGYIKTMRMLNFTRQGMSCPRCSDGVSYPEKFLINILDQANIKYIHQAGKSVFNWITDKSQYDFYLPDYNWIIETHGLQHYSDWAKRKYNSNNYTQEEADQMKEENALSHGINKYIILDCSQSKCEYIKNKIENSLLASIIILEKIDWNSADMFASNSLLVKVCNDYKNRKNNNEVVNAHILSEKYDVSILTIYNYLRRGSKLGLCEYDGSENINTPMVQSISIPLKCYYNDNIYGFSCKNEFKRWLKDNNYHVDISTIEKHSKLKESWKGFYIEFITKIEYNKLYNNSNIQTFGEKFNEFYVQE